MDSGDDDAGNARTKLDSPRWNRRTVDAAVTPTPASRPGAFDKLRNRYALGDELGRGGMGRVIAATDVALDRQVAIKQALSDSPELLARFEREARITAKLGHPAIVPVFDSGRDDEGHPYYVMRRIEGEPLAHKVKGTLRARLELLPNLLSAVDATAFAHARRIVHRDIKPWNILVGAYGETLLIDWGLARELDDPSDETPVEDHSSLTRAGRAYGTPGFMAPEQARGDAVDARADVYALGATLFYVLAGDSQVKRNEESLWIQRAAKGEAPAPLEMLPDGVPRELVAIVGKAMAMRADDRYADAGALAEDLRRFLAGQLVAAHAYTTRERLWRFVRRHKVAVVASLVALAIATYAIGNVISERADARTARALAEVERAEAADRADEIILDRAQRYAMTEPARAVVALRELAPTSKRWHEARAIASAASVRGIPSGSHDHTGALRTVAFASDGHRVLTAAADGAVRIRDLANGTSREVWRDSEPLGHAEWIDDRSILVGAHDGLVIVDADTGAHRMLATTPTQPWPWLAGAVARYHDAAQHTLEEVALADGARTHLADDVTAAAAAGDATIIATHRDVRLLANGKVSVLAQGEATVVTGSPARVAALFAHEIVEWNVADGHELHRLAIDPHTIVFQLAYGATGLMIELATEPRRTIVDGQGRPWFDGTFTGAWFASTGARTAVLGDDGELRLVGGDLVERLPTARTDLRVVALAADWVVAGSTDGALYWWDLRDRLPAELKPGITIAPCIVWGGRVVAQEGDSLYVAELATGQATEVLNAPMVTCIPTVFDGKIAVRTLGETRMLDVAKQTVAPMPANDAWVVDLGRDALVYVRGREVHELRDGRDTQVATLPGDATAIVARGGARYAHLADGALLRVDTGAQVAKQTPIDWMVVDAAGTLWFTRDRTLLRWNGSGAPVTVSGLPETIVQLAAYADAGVTAQLRSNALWVVTPDGHAVERLAAGWAKFIRLAQRVAVAVQRDGTVVVDLGTGITSLHPGLAFGAAISGDGRQLAIATSGSDAMLRVYTDRVPSEPAPLRAWLARATNAKAAPGTDALQWPGP